MQPTEIELSAGLLPDYLRERALVPPGVEVTACELAGGVSNTVLLAEWRGGAVVVKQSLGRLRVSTEWRFDRGRIFVERACLETLDELLPGAAPTVVFSDDANYAFGMTYAPAGGAVWRDRLAAGDFDLNDAARAAALLARLQHESARAPRLAERFASQMPLLEGRVDPFHRTVAQAHPELRDAIDAEVTRLLGTRRVLSHGDFSPKNLIAYPDRMLVLDCEVAHWGDPAFDVAFGLCHLLLDGVHLPGTAAPAGAAAAQFWETYSDAGGDPGEDRAVVSELGILLLARVDGKSPLPTLPPALRGAVRACGTQLLLGEHDVPGAIAFASRFLDQPVE